MTKEEIAYNAASQWRRCFKCDGFVDDDCKIKCDRDKLITCDAWYHGYRTALMALIDYDEINDVDKRIIPFNVNLINKVGVKVKTRSGLNVRVLCTDFEGNDYKVMACVKALDKSESSESEPCFYEVPLLYHIDGSISSDRKSPLDLILEVPCVKLPRRMTNKELAEWLRNSTNDNVREMIEINPNAGDYITGSYIYEDEEDFLEVPENIKIRVNGGDFFEPIVKEAIKWE